MRVHRGSLFWGLFFLLLGGIPLADRAGLIDVGALGGVGRLWPLAIIAIGVAILASRTRFAVVGTLLAAVLVGGLAGLGLASVGAFVTSGDCSPGGAMTPVSQSGTLDTRASVSFSLSCGTLDVTAGAGRGWSLQGAWRGTAPGVTAAAARLDITTPRGSQRQEWRVGVPADLGAMDVTVNAGSGRLDLSATRLSRLRLDVNAGDLVLVAGQATVDLLDATANAGRLRLTLGGATQGTVRTNAGGLDLCVPADARLEVVLREQNLSGSNLSERGLARSGNMWTREGSGALIHLEVDGNVSGLTLEPAGGCR